MNASDHGLISKGPPLNSTMKPAWITLTDDDLARLGGRRAEIIMVLRQWHGYGRIRANRAFSRWLYSHSPVPARDSAPAEQETSI